MVINPNTRIKLRKFFKKYGKLIAIIALIWISVITVNELLKINNKNKKPTTTYEPHTAVIDTGKKAPVKVQNSIEEFIEKYIDHCNNEQYTDAYNMLSDECKEYFGNFNTYAYYVSNKFDKPKIYSLQNYSNANEKYIYNIKLYDDILATGLTNSVYNYQEEKITVSYDEDRNLVFSIGNFIGKEKVNSVQENDYLKVDVRNKTVKYGTETYEVRFTNRSENIIVIKNNTVKEEIVLKLNGEIREEMYNEEIVIYPGESNTYTFVFEKFYDDSEESQSIIFNTIRVVERYIEENPNEENAIEKFSIEVGLK